MTEKLTPRVGDRVLVRFGTEGGPTYIGNVVDMGNNGQGTTAGVDVDGVGRRACWLHELEVIDREPVEWPEGFGPSSMGHRYVAVRLADSSVFSMTRRELEQFAANVPDVLARWDDLVGGAV